jgi:hypothetical protein
MFVGMMRMIKQTCRAIAEPRVAMDDFGAGLDTPTAEMVIRLANRGFSPWPSMISKADGGNEMKSV